MNGLVEWLNGCYDRAEQAARDAGGRNWEREAYGCVVDATNNGIIVYGEGTPSREQADHIADHDPAWRLADIARKRKILAEHDDQHECTDLRGAEYPYVGCRTVRLLAEEFANEPGYDERWRP